MTKRDLTPEEHISLRAEAVTFSGELHFPYDKSIMSYHSVFSSFSISMLFYGRNFPAQIYKLKQ